MISRRYGRCSRSTASKDQYLLQVTMAYMRG